jgi:hypothetical protein
MDNYFKVIVEDMSAFETFETTSDNMNFQDYKYFKQKAKGDFNPALKIADLFISDTNQKSDFNQYVF